MRERNDQSFGQAGPFVARCRASFGNTTVALAGHLVQEFTYCSTVRAPAARFERSENHVGVTGDRRKISSPTAAAIAFMTAP